jgi:hypothetical protein
MIHSIQIVATMGVIMFLMFTFQLLTGLRVIKFKPKIHFKIHKVNGITLYTLAFFHGIYALGTFVFGWFQPF